MNTHKTAIEPYSGTAEAQVRTWVDMPIDERKRVAMGAGNTLDEDILFDLVGAHARLHSSSGRTSVNTLQAYRQGIRVYLAFCKTAGVNLLHPGPDDGALYRFHLTEKAPRNNHGQAIAGRKLAPSTVWVYLAGVKALYAALRWSRATTAAPLIDVKPPTDKVAAWDKVQPYPEASIAAMLEAAEPRDRVMVLLGCHAGLRIAEAARLAWSDVDFPGSTFTVTGKGEKTRHVPISTTLQGGLEDLRNRLPLPVNVRVLGGIAPPALRARMRRLAKRAGVTYSGFHALRHSAGTEMSRAGLCEKDIARVLGHASTKTTAVYSTWASTEARDVMTNW